MVGSLSPWQIRFRRNVTFAHHGLGLTFSAPSLQPPFIISQRDRFGLLAEAMVTGSELDTIIS
ncbi:unnamed protein product (plasmid) [Mycetohabitans rhizoxinica HKI 454]|uniref:Uncharacterized protein n=1 Tax=Mycetohabitans rhizoxinica (strain DSM 19002 / CIP 109453 / HKI 454) TaxID=882378 RepID=E5AW17_MYCRK|nr:unnamed protein product [Mycetohabitans rhizoxinica HKI 454]